MDLRGIEPLTSRLRTLRSPERHDYTAKKLCCLTPIIGRSQHSCGFAVVVICATQKQKDFPCRGVSHTVASFYVYFQTEDTATDTSGTSFTGGTLALTGGAGIALGAVVTSLAMKGKKKSGEESAEEK